MANRKEVSREMPIRFIDTHSANAITPDGEHPVDWTKVLPDTLVLV
jgi:hypothetical protein